MDVADIFSEREAREARSALSEIEQTLSSDQIFEPIIRGLPIEVVDCYRRALLTQQRELEFRLNAYEAAKKGDYSELKKRAGNDPGLSLIVARIACGFSQKDLARRLGLKEQQIQRYEADRYKSISLSNYRRIAHALGVRWEMKLDDESAWIGSGWEVASDISATDVKKVIQHAKENSWFDAEEMTFEEESHNYLHRYISDHILNYGSPTLLRTGLNISDAPNDLLLIAWKSRVTRVAEEIIGSRKIEYQGLDISWLQELVRLSVNDNGPVLAQGFLLDHGIVLVSEPQISGLKLDGAAFLVSNVPVIGLTVRRDTVDNFWFTLLHEIGHVVLHYGTGLRSGFFDDSDSETADEMEEEANRFASNMLIPSEKWNRSTVKISKKVSVIEKFAEDLDIHPAIVFGRIQKERGDYKTFSNNVGRGLVRKWLV